jgi:teichoic acid transport system permease protein
MQEMITGGSACIRSYSHLVTKMKFPVSVIPTYYNLSHLFVHWALLLITIILFAVFGFLPDKYYLQIPLYMLMMFVFFTVWALFSGMLAAISKDFQNLVRSFSTAIFWMSGIVYNVDRIHNPTVRLLLKFNPVTVIASGYRKSFIYKEWFFEDPIEMACFCTTLLVFTLLALWGYDKTRKEIPDVL